MPQGAFPKSIWPANEAVVLYLSKFIPKHWKHEPVTSLKLKFKVLQVRNSLRSHHFGIRATVRHSGVPANSIRQLIYFLFWCEFNYSLFIGRTQTGDLNFEIIKRSMCRVCTELRVKREREMWQHSDFSIRLNACLAEEKVFRMQSKSETVRFH